MSDNFEEEKKKLELEKAKIELEKSRIELENYRQGATEQGARSQDDNVSDKSRLVATLLSFFLGGLAIHRFYVGRVKSGVCQILFGWLTLFIWNLVDFIMILAGAFKDKDGRVLKNWETDK